MTRSISYILSVIIFCFSFIPVVAQEGAPAVAIAKAGSSKDDEKLRIKFNLAKNHLHKGEIKQALPIFKELYALDSSNANINYLLGVCYTEEPFINDTSIYYLERATNSVIMKYDILSYKEKGAPIFVYYYLSIANSQHGNCGEANEIMSSFHELYGIEKNDYYVRDAQRWIDKCKSGEIAMAPAEPEKMDETGRKIVTKKIEYTTQSPLYGVQIGAYSRLDPRRYFNGLKNVEAFMDNAGVIRYVIGHFIHRSQAEALMNIVESAGFKDAFIVDVNKEKKFEDELISIDDISLKAPFDKEPEITGKVDFKVQIGAFRDSIPIELLLIYLQVEGIREHSQDSLTILTVGSYATYEEAVAKKEELLKWDIPGVFVAAFNRNQKIPIERAIRESGKVGK